jgi:GNAT superfamily N-acetyltransferase
MDYLFLFGDVRTAYSDMSVKTAIASDGNVFMAWEENHPVGYICLSEELEKTNILYAFTVPEMRRKGVFSELLAHAVQHSPRSLRLSISDSHKCYGIISHTCRKQGFEMQSSCIVYSGKSGDFIRWKEYMAGTGGTMCEILERQGFSCVSFADADQDLLDQILFSDKSEFGNQLDVRAFFENPYKRMNRNMSFAAVKDGELAAYTLVSSPDASSAVFEHISASRKQIGSGCILLPFSKAMESFEKYGCRRAAYAMYEDNEHANNFRKKLLDKVTSSRKRSENYILNKNNRGD